MPRSTSVHRSSLRRQAQRPDAGPRDISLPQPAADRGREVLASVHLERAKSRDLSDDRCDLSHAFPSACAISSSVCHVCCKVLSPMHHALETTESPRRAHRQQGGKEARVAAVRGGVRVVADGEEQGDGDGDGKGRERERER